MDVFSPRLISISLNIYLFLFLDRYFFLSVSSIAFSQYLSFVFLSISFCRSLFLSHCLFDSLFLPFSFFLSFILFSCFLCYDLLCPLLLNLTSVLLVLGFFSYPLAMLYYTRLCYALLSYLDS
uniref:Uncharacterized protein n=1 Tax=Rhipicephalus pulchellus TaxID=72859 RepID=L7LZD1_RHIPC